MGRHPKVDVSRLGIKKLDLYCQWLNIIRDMRIMTKDICIVRPTKSSREHLQLTSYDLAPIGVALNM